ncbi:MAG: hypothetical protein MHMPM18_003073, partial [Marteilia pararefringens]
SYDFSNDASLYNRDETSLPKKLKKEIKEKRPEIRNIIEILKNDQLDSTNKLEEFTIFLQNLSNNDYEPPERIYISNSLKLANAVTKGLFHDFVDSQKSKKSVKTQLPKTLDALMNLLLLCEDQNDDNILSLLQSIFDITTEFFVKDLKLRTKVVGLIFEIISVNPRHSLRLGLLSFLEDSQLISKNNYDLTTRRILQIFESFNPSNNFNNNCEFREIINSVKSLLSNHENCLEALVTKLVKRIGLKLEMLKKSNSQKENSNNNSFISWSTIMEIQIVLRLTNFGNKSKDKSSNLNIILEILSAYITKISLVVNLPFVYQILLILVEKQCESNDYFMPLTSLLLTILNKHDFNNIPEVSSMKKSQNNFTGNLQIDLESLLNIPKGSSDSDELNGCLFTKFTDLLLKYLEHWQTSMAFPELATPILIWMKKFIGNLNQNQNRLAKSAKSICHRLEKQVDFVRTNRKCLDIDLRNIESVEKGESDLKKKLESF